MRPRPLPRTLAPIHAQTDPRERRDPRGETESPEPKCAIQSVNPVAVADALKKASRLLAPEWVVPGRPELLWGPTPDNARRTVCHISLYPTLTNESAGVGYVRSGTPREPVLALLPDGN